MDPGKSPCPEPTETSVSAASSPDERVLSSAELFDGSREVIIDHQGELYRLRHTSKGKLILTK